MGSGYNPDLNQSGRVFDIIFYDIQEKEVRHYKMKTRDKIIYDLAGGTGSWSAPYREAGYTVRLFDILNGDDVRLLRKPEEKVYGILAAPPCTHLCLVGALYWKSKGESALLEALSVVDACLRIVQVTKPRFWCLENPTGRLIHYLGEPLMRFNPCDYGDGYTKKTCLWGCFNPPGKWNPVQPVKGSPGQRSQDAYNRKVLKRPFGHKRRSAVRSITPPGFARAFFECNL